MSGLAWHEASGGLHSGQYRVIRLSRPADRRWQLEITRRGVGWKEPPTVSAHRTRRGAMASAEVHEIQRLRTVRLQIHLGLCLLATVTWIIHAASAGSSLTDATVSMALFALALKSVANALDAADADGEASDRNRRTVITRWINVDSLLPPLTLRYEASNSPSETNIRVLDPSEWDVLYEREAHRVASNVPVRVLRSLHVTTRPAPLLRELQQQ